MRPLALALLPAALAAGPVDDQVNLALARVTAPGLIRTAIGVTRTGAAIPALITKDDLDFDTPKRRVLIVAGLDGSRAGVDAALDALQSPAPGLSISAVPIANPEGYAHGNPLNGVGGDPTRGYPPQGEHYSSPTNPEAQYLWRWIPMHAPDLVVVVGKGDLAAALNKAGAVPAIEVSPHGKVLPKILVARGGVSPARAEMQKRLRRTPLQVAQQLAQVYGKELPEAVYIPAMALVARLRLGDLTNDPAQLAMVERIVEPYFTGARDSMAKPTGSHLSGHLVFGDLYAHTKKPRYLALARAAADTGFDSGGGMKESLPMHNEMSDSVFMGCPIAAQVGRLTGDRKYSDLAMRHMRFMLRLNLRPDGLHRHSPLDESAWGRGNGFPALGLALALSEMSDPEMLAQFQAHMEAMLGHQDPTGAWHQVVDRTDSYRELTVTCMTAFAMQRGIKRGWLDRARFAPSVDRAWYAIKTRVGADGSLVDVCTGTGKQKSLRDYFDRGAILGPDPRGGAMAFLVATELAAR
jgi:rhamnogalacturonyl hydrolase YesR